MASTLNISLRLSLICAVAAFALANVAEVTRAPIAESEARAQREAVEAVLPAFAELAVDTLDAGGDAPTVYFTGLGEAGPTGTAFTAVSGLGYSGEVEIMVGVGPDGSVSGVRVLRHAETPGLGANYAAPVLLDELYKGRPIDGGWKLGKDGGDIDAVTGATVTGRAIVDAIERGGACYLENKGRLTVEPAPEPAEDETS